MFNFQQCLDDLWEDRVCWWLGCDVWGFNCMMLQLLGYEWCSASCSDLWPIDDKLRQSSFDMSLACTCMSMCTEHMRGWWWLMVGRKNVLGYCSVLQHCYIENHRIQKTQFSAGMCVCVWAMWIRFKKNILAHDNVFGPIQKTEEWFKISNLNPANLPLTFCGMGKCSGKRSALKYAKAHTASVSSMDEPQKGHREAKRRFIMAGLRMLKAPAVLWPH